MTSSLLPLAWAAAAALALFGCEEMDRGPSGPEPPKTTAAAPGAHAVADHPEHAAFPAKPSP